LEAKEANMRVKYFLSISAVAIGLVAFISGGAKATSVLFNFDDLPQHSSLPSNYTVDGLTAHFSATGQGFSIQSANVLGFTPVGFGGNSIYPNSVFAADLLVSFSQPLTDFSILYAPEEYASDTSAIMRVTAYMNGVGVGTNTTTAPNPGTWPTGTLSFNSVLTFNSVVVHYDSSNGATDSGPVFMADDMNVTLASTAVTPLPSTWLMLLSGFVGLGFFAYRGTKKRFSAIAAA
jgi:hypothetical protein